MIARILPIAFVALVLASPPAFAASATAPTTVPAPREIRGAKVIAFGDSITSDKAKKKWPHWTTVLKERFQLDLVNAGVGGNTTKQGLDRLDTDVLAQNPDFVLISFGMNDHVMRAKNQPGVPLDAFEQNLILMVEKVRAAGAIPVFVTTNYIVEGEPGKEKRKYYYDRHHPALYADVGGALAWLDQYIDVMRKVGARMSVGVADVRKACDAYDPREFTTDGVHSGALGQKVYAQVVGDFLEKHYASPAARPTTSAAAGAGEKN